MKSFIALIAMTLLPAFAGAAEFADLQTMDAAAMTRVNPFPNPSNPDSCYLQGIKDGLCVFKCRSGESFQVKPVKPEAASPYVKCGAADYRAAQPPDAGAILAQIQQQQAAQQQMIISQNMQFALQAAASLRKDLKGYGVKAKVGLVNLPGGRYGLSVEFANGDDFELVEDMFYQDPGDGPNYMDHKVLLTIAKSAAIENTKALKVCWLKTMEKDTCVYACKDGAAHTQPMQRPNPWDNEPVIPCPQLVFPF